MTCQFVWVWRCQIAIGFDLIHSYNKLRNVPDINLANIYFDVYMCDYGTVRINYDSVNHTIRAFEQYVIHPVVCVVSSYIFTIIVSHKLFKIVQ